MGVTSTPIAIFKRIRHAATFLGSSSICDESRTSWDQLIVISDSFLMQEPNAVGKAISEGSPFFDAKV
jgi:hypothetical protein